MEAPRHVLLVLDDEGDLHSVGEESEGEALGDARRETPDRRDRSDDGGARTTSSRFWGVYWDRVNKVWKVVHDFSNAFGEYFPSLLMK